VDLTGKVAVVTGTANPRGIGIALCRGYGGAGARIVLADIDEAGLSARVAELRGEGIEACGVAVDMKQADDIRRFAEDAFAAFGRVDILHLNHVAPSTFPGGGLLSPETEAWEVAVDVNLLGALRSIKAFVPSMIAADDWGYVLATVSGAGVNGLAYGHAPYTVTKAATAALMECLYGQLRDARSKVRCAVVVPGLVQTSNDDVRETAEMLRNHGFPATLTQPAEVAAFTLDAIARDRFWVHPTVADDERLWGGRHRETLEWADAMYFIRATTMANRANPDPYLWGPPSDPPPSNDLHDLDMMSQEQVGC
jgi:NAD(P)-dependent dehydrogenase (short-subunit alcohol dehydrogenase family)